MSTGFAISEYPDSEAIVNELERLISQPIMSLKKVMTSYSIHYTKLYDVFVFPPYLIGSFTLKKRQ